MRVFVPRARDDIYQEGNYVYVKRLGNNFCLLAFLERYILMGDIILSSSVALFRPVRLFICSLDCLSNQPSSFSGYVSLVLKREIIYVRLSVATSNIITLAVLRVNNQELTLISFPMRWVEGHISHWSLVLQRSHPISLFLWIPLSSIHKTLPWAVCFLAAMWKDNRVFLWASIRPDFKEYFTFRLCIRD